MSWEKLIAVSELADRPRAVKKNGRQLAVFQAGDDCFAVDNRCPHEGYPLAEGSVDDDCVLTCNWHNWKFSLPDGACVLGGDDVRAYPVRIEDGYVWGDLSDPSPEEVEARILKGLKRAFDERDFGWICREVTRLKLSGFEPVTAVRTAIEWSHDRLEFGYEHSYAAAADWLKLAGDFEGDWERQLNCLSSCVDHMSFDSLRHRKYAYPAAAPTFGHDELLAAIEAQDHEQAESLVQRALDEGLHWADLERTFATAALEHVNSFGHSLIYVYKTGALIQSLGESVERPLLLSSCREICYATREDLIPEFAAYRPAVDQLPDELAGKDGDLDSSAFFEKSINQAVAVTEELLAANSIEAVYDAQLATLARNLLFYDQTYDTASDRPVNENVGWLAFTHGLTFANAVRMTCTKFPELWRHGLLQLACFIGRNCRFIDRSLDGSQWHVDDLEAFRSEVLEIVLDHGMRDPVFSAHMLKTPMAVFEELPTASEECRDYLTASINRFLHSPIKQFHSRRLARQAIDLVERDYGG